MIVCSVIESLTHYGKDRKHLQRVAGDILAIEKLGEILIQLQTSNMLSEAFDVEMNGTSEKTTL